MFSDAHQEACDSLRSETRRPSVEDTVKPVSYQGVECGGTREYSDTLLIPDEMRGHMFKHQIPS